MKILITGGAGFIGCNAAEYFHSKGHKITILDNLCRKGSNLNINYLGSKITFIKGDVRNQKDVRKAMDTNPDIVLHLAAQVAVTTSVIYPEEDMSINLIGTFNILEEMRNNHEKTFLIYASTNKVYGELKTCTAETKRRYVFNDLKHGVSEETPLDFYSPYGCSKGAADSYVLDYARIYGLKTTCFRQSCIYGPRQMGISDQGWVAWFIISSLFKKPITIYGTGKQVRDILWVGDLLEAYNLAIQNQDKITGQAFNIGGGINNTLSILEFQSYLKRVDLNTIYKFSDWRPGDQKVYVSDIRKAYKAFKWEPKTNAMTGLDSLIKWCRKNKSSFKKIGII